MCDLTTKKEIAKILVYEDILSTLIGMLKFLYNKNTATLCIILISNCVIDDYSIRQVIEGGIIQIISDNFLENDTEVKVVCIYIIQAILQNLVNVSIIEQLVEEKCFEVFFEFLKLRYEEVGYLIMDSLYYFLDQISEGGLKSVLLEHFEKIGLVEILNEKYNSITNSTFSSLIEKFLSKFYHYNEEEFAYSMKQLSSKKLKPQKISPCDFKIGD